MKPRPYRSVSPSTVLLIRQVIVGTMIVAFFSMLLISVWYGTRADSLTISTVTVIGGETIDPQEVESVARGVLHGAYLKLVPRAFAFTYPHEEIINQVKALPKVKEVQVVPVGTTELRVEFSEYTPHALWCTDQTSESCVYLDDSGYAFATAPKLEGGLFLRLIAIGKAPAIHTQAFETEQYRLVLSLVERLSDSGWFVTGAEVDLAGDAFFSVLEGGEFKVSLTQSADETMSNLLTVLGSEQFSHLEPGNFEYIDLRFGSKVFVNEVTTEVSASTTTDTKLESSSADDSGESTTTLEEEAVAETVAEEVEEEGQ